MLASQLPRRNQNADRDRQVEAARLFRQFCRREIDRDPPLREIELRILQRGAHAIAALLDFGLGESDQIECGQASRQMDLDGYKWA